MKWKTLEGFVAFLVFAVVLFPVFHVIPIPGFILIMRNIPWLQHRMDDPSFARWWGIASLFVIAAYLGMQAFDAGSNDETSPFRIARLIRKWRWRALICVGIAVLVIIANRH